MSNRPDTVPITLFALLAFTVGSYAVGVVIGMILAAH